MIVLHIIHERAQNISFLVVQYVHDYVLFACDALRCQLRLDFVQYGKWVCHPLSVDTKKTRLRSFTSYALVFLLLFLDKLYAKINILVHRYVLQSMTRYSAPVTW